MVAGRHTSFLVWCSAWFVLSGLARAADLTISQAVVAWPQIRVYVAGAEEGELTATQVTATLGSQPLQVTGVAPFNPGGEGIAYAVLVDISKSLHAGEFGQISASLDTLIGHLSERDRMAIYTVGNGVSLTKDFTADKDALRAALKQLGPTDDLTHLHQGLVQAMNIGRRRDEGLPGRRVILILSDGKDEGSGFTAEDVLSSAHAEHIPIYAIGFSHLGEAERNRYLELLHRFAAASGGDYVNGQAHDLESAYRQIESSIEHVGVVSLDANGVQPEGQLARLQLTLKQGETASTDGIDVRLLKVVPNPVRPIGQTPTNPALVWWREPLYQWAIGMGLLVLFGCGIGLLVWRSKSRSAVPEAKLGQTEPGSAELEEIPAELEALSTPEPVGVDLIVVRGGVPGASHHLRLNGPAVIGRGEGCALALDADERVSRKHCELLVQDGLLLVRDLGSVSGTSVNGLRIRGLHKLENGDLLGAGSTELRVMRSKG